MEPNYFTQPSYGRKFYNLNHNNMDDRDIFNTPFQRKEVEVELADLEDLSQPITTEDIQTLLLHFAAQVAELITPYLKEGVTITPTRSDSWEAGLELQIPIP